MPIRLNLLAESQALEEIRRRDPAKRAMWLAFVVVAGVLCWGLFLLGRIALDSSRYTGLETELNRHTNQYNAVLASKKKLTEITFKLAALNSFATNRYLHGNMMDAFQHVIVDGIQFSRLRSEQSFDVMPPQAAGKSDSGQPIAAKPGRSTERIKLLIDLRDTSDHPGRELINKFEESLAQNNYFQCSRITTNNMVLRNLSAPTVDINTGIPFVQINLELFYPERVR